MPSYYIAAGVALAIFSSAAAEPTMTQTPKSDLPLKRLVYYKDVKYGRVTLKSYFPTKPAADLMPSTAFHQYSEYLKTYRCEAALELLKTYFVKAHPKFSKVTATGPTSSFRFCKDDCNYWRDYVGAKFGKVESCVHTRDIREHQNAATKRIRVVPKYEQLGKIIIPQSYEEEVIWRRDSAVQALINSSDLGNASSTEKLIKLIERGDIFDLKPTVEYYIIMRACILGTNCKHYTARKRELESDLGRDHMSLIEYTADMHHIFRPSLNDLIANRKKL